MDKSSRSYSRCRQELRKFSTRARQPETGGLTCTLRHGEVILFATEEPRRLSFVRGFGFHRAKGELVLMAKGSQSRADEEDGSARTEGVPARYIHLSPLFTCTNSIQPRHAYSVQRSRKAPN